MTRPRVLIAEDDMVTGAILRDELTQAGYEVVGPVASAVEANAAARAEALDCAILDANLRGTPPAGAAAALQERGIPFLYVSGYDAAHIERILPPAPCLAKPLRLRGFLETLERLAGRRPRPFGASQTAR